MRARALVGDAARLAGALILCELVATVAELRTEVAAARRDIAALTRRHRSTELRAEITRPRG